jgi:galactokinase
MSDLIRTVYNEFKDRFNEEPLLVESPGRVNFIGDHTDYNDGFVLPASIQKKIVMGVSKNSLNKIRAFSIDMNEFVILEIQNLIKNEKHWVNYIKGVTCELIDKGKEINGFDLVFSGDLPIGAGMSSSAALEGALLVLLNRIFDLNLTRKQMAKIGQLTEHKHVGVNCGIMDQFVNLHGMKNKAIKLDCRSLDFEMVPFNSEDIKIVLCNSKVSHNLASSEYNTRRDQCEEGVRILKNYDPEIMNLRDVSQELLEKHSNEFDEVVYRRCKFVLEENKRVHTACTHLEEDNFEAFGACMFESHKGLSKDYEVSCYELDLLVDLARNRKGVYGSRMMGGGFGGCTINLVHKDYVEKFKQDIQKDYTLKTGIDTEVYVTQIHSGTKIIHKVETEKTQVG